MFSYTKEQMNIQKKEIIRQMNNAGIDFSFVGESNTNGCSIYFEFSGMKFRFSDHSVTNVNRIVDEVHFPLPINNVMGKGTVCTDLFVHEINMKYQKLIWKRLSKKK